MKAAASTIQRRGRGVLKAISAPRGTEPALAREYQAIFKSNGKPMVIVDHDMTISLANAEFERLSGYTKKDIEGNKRWMEFVAREDQKRMQEYHLLRKSDPMLAPRCCEFRFVNRHGKIKNIVLTIGQIPGTTKSMISLQDVTERRQAEVTQRASEERYQTFFENSKDAVYITTRDGAYVDANRAALDLFGYAREEMKKVKAQQLYANPADARRLQDEIEKKGFVQDFEVRLRKKDKTELDCLFTVTALRGDDGSILEYQGIARDVTERKQAAEALRESEGKYRTIFDSMLEGYFEVDLAGNFTFFNEAVAKFIGYSRDELMGLNYRKYTSPEEEQRLFQAFNEVYKTGNPHEIGAYEIIKKDGSIGIAAFSVSLLRNAAGEPIGFRGVTRDMTEKRKIETTLQQSEENYRKILEMAPDGIAINRLKDERYVLVNDAFCRHTGYRREEIIGRSALELNLFLDRADHKLVAKTLRKEGRVDGLEINFWAKDGTILNDLVSARPIRFKGEDCLLVVATNINALKKAEEALRESEERYRSIIEDTEESYFETDLGGNYTFVNDAECKMLGYTREELIGMNYQQLSHETIAKKIYHFFNETYKTGKPIKLMDQEITRKDGTKLIAEVSASLIKDSEGQPIGFRGIARDISKRTQAEEALRQSEEKYRTILETMQEAYYEIDLAGKYIFVNEAFYEHLGYTKEELIGTKSRQYQDETTAREFYEAYSRLYRTGEPIRAIEGVWINKNGTKRTYELSASLMRDPEGKPIGFRGVSRDVTERKLAEERLRQSEERYRTVLETMWDGYWETDLAGAFTFVNEAQCRMAGSPRERLIGRNNRQYTDETTAKKMYEVFNKVYKTREPLKNYEFEFIKKDGTKACSELSLSLIRDAQGKPIGFRGVSRDVTERKQMEETLRQSEERYRTIIETMQDGYWETDLPGNFTFVNDAECKISGTPREQLIGRNNQQYADKTTAKKLYKVFKGIYTTGEPVKSCDFEFIRRNGTRRFAEFSASPIRDAQGKTIGFRGVTRDVTERKRAEEVLRQSEEKYRTIIKTIQEGYFETDLAGNFTFVNDAQCKITGTPREQLLGKNNRDYTSEEEAKRLYQIYNRIYRTGEPEKGYAFEFTRRDGTKTFHEVSASLMRDSEGKPIGFRGISRDVTERKQMEETLHQSEEKYRTIIETMQDGYFEADLKGRYTFANEALRRRQGYSKDELIGMSNREFQNETNAKKAYRAFHEVYRTGEPIKALEMEVIKKDGTRGFSELSVSLIRDAQGKPIGFRGISHDITERKQMEETLRQSEEKYRTILENMQEGYFELDLTGHMTFVNDTVCRHLGYTKEELIGAGYRQLQDETTAKKMNEIYKEVYRTGKSVKAVETEYNRKDGTKGDYEISVSLIRDSEGKPIGFRGVSRDVTERKQMEETLRQSEEQYRTIIETMQEGYFEIDLKGRYTFANEALCKRQGYTKDELIGMSNREFQDETNAQKAYQAFHEVYRTGEPNETLEMETIGKDGTKGIYEISVSLIRDAQGKPIGFRGISHDITEHKQIEEILRQNEERYRTIVETMYDGYFEVDLAGNFTFVNDAQCRMTGSSKERLIGKNNREYTTKEEAKKLYEAFSRVYRTREPVKGFAFEYAKRDGTKAFNEISVFLIRDAQGKPIGFRGMSRDVTERKLAEEALRQSEEKYRNILENMQEGYTELDLKGNWTLVNDKVVRDLGYTKEKLIGTNSRRYRDGKNEEKIYQAYNELYKTGETIRALEVVYVSKNGIERTYELTASLIRDEQGKPIGFRAVSRDVTERKKAEEQLKRYAAELERSNEEVKNFAYIVSHDLRVPLINLKGYTSELRSALEVIGSNFDAALPHLIDEKRSEVAMALHEDVPEALEFITNSVSRMDSFINAILILSRLGRQDLKPEPIDMNALVKTTVETMSHQIQERGIEVIVGSLPHVAADRTSMEQIMGNILSNAVKYPDSSRPCRIEVAAETNNGETIFSIRDTGRGIAAEDMHKVFAPFRRAGKQDTQGEGMGLAYVQTLVHRHGGRIWCESELGKGTTFAFTISSTFKQGAYDA